MSPFGGRRAAAAAGQPGQGLGDSRLASAWRHTPVAQRLPPVPAAGSSTVDGPSAADAGDELPLWRLLRQQGFSADGVSRMQAATTATKGRRRACVSGSRMGEEKVQRDVAANMAALRAEGLDTASIERLFEQNPRLLTATHDTFASALAALRQLAAQLPGNPRAVQAPPGATQLGVALWLYPTAAAFLLMRTNLGSLIDSNLRLRQRLGINDQDTAIGLFKQYSTLVTNFERAEAMVAHLQGLQASGALSAEQGEHSGRVVSCCLLSAPFGRFSCSSVLPPSVCLHSPCR